VPSLRLVLADDHGVLRPGLCALLRFQGGFEVVGEAESADDAVQLVTARHPNVAVLDVRMPGGGIEATRRISELAPDVAVLVLSQYDDTAYLREALATGALGHALKLSSGAELVEAIRTVARGDTYLHPTLARTLVQETLAPKGRSVALIREALSDREAQVLPLVGLGHASQHIAEQPFLSVRTVETYKARGVEKLGLGERAELVQYALESGLLQQAEAR
jgi:two-component system, NarL family, response regulator NreC